MLVPKIFSLQFQLLQMSMFDMLSLLVNLVPVTLLIVLGSVLFPCTAIGAATIFCHQFSNLLEVVMYIPFTLVTAILAGTVYLFSF
jgi:hypothetical protein